MIKNNSIISTEVNGRVFEFSCPTDSPLNDAIDANFQINAFLLGRAEQFKNSQNQESEKENEVKSENESEKAKSCCV